MHIAATPTHPHVRTHAQAKLFSQRQPVSGHPGWVRFRAAKEDDLAPGRGAFRNRDELVDSNFSTAQVGAPVSREGMLTAGELGEGAGGLRVSFLGLSKSSPYLS